MRVFLAEDDPSLGALLLDALEGAGYSVDWARDGEEALDDLTHGPYDAAVLDLGLPAIDGLDVLARARAEGVATPVLILTARDGVTDRVRGLDLGADDYLVKPFATLELLARLRALLRRGAKGRPGIVTLGDLVFDPATRVATRAGERLDLTPKELALLDYLLRNAGEVVTRTMLAEHAWNRSFDSLENVVDAHLKNLRRKLEHHGRPRLLHTVRGIGFVLCESPP